MTRPQATRRESIDDEACAAADLPSGTATGPLHPAQVAPLPTIRLGTLEVSRLILGSNPFFGYSHKDAQTDTAMRAYFTDERIRALLDEAADHGITAVAAPPTPRWIELWRAYVREGGRLRFWLAQPDPQPDRMKQAIAEAAEGGAHAIFVQGHRAEERLDEPGGLHDIGEWVEAIKEQGLPAGLAAHRPHVHLAVEKAGLPTDFYFQCLYVPDTYLPADRERAMDAIRQIRKPVVAYKILAAGRLAAEEGFGYALRSLRAKDGICVGVFPNEQPDMLRRNVGLFHQMSGHIDR